MNYYISNSGNDATSVTALSPSQPWKTITRLNSYLPMNGNAGDTIYFKCGEIYTGILKVTKSITIKSYGSGEPPVLNVPDVAIGLSVNISNVIFKKI